MIVWVEDTKPHDHGRRCKRIKSKKIPLCMLSESVNKSHDSDELIFRSALKVTDTNRQLRDD